MVQITRVEEHYGYEISWGHEVDEEGVANGKERVVSIKKGRLTINLGQLVTANGRLGVPKGTRGLVTGLCAPNTFGRTTDIIDCEFEAHQREPLLLIMKLKDLLI